jgi:hypothetical protein
MSVATQIFIPIPYPRSVFFPSRILDPEATSNNPSIVIFKKSVQVYRKHTQEVGINLTEL